MEDKIEGESMCEYCEENKKKKLIQVEVKYKFENPEAYGFPEICHWEKNYLLNYCPMCR